MPEETQNQNEQFLGKGAEKELANESLGEDKSISNEVVNLLNENEISKLKESNINFDPIVKIALNEIEANKQNLTAEIEELTKRKIALEEDLKKSFTGQSDSIARKVKGFQDYLTGALQDLAQSAEQLELVVQPVVLQPSPLDESEKEAKTQEEEKKTEMAIANTFQPDEKIIRSCLDQFQESPDFYAEPWKLRRSLEKKDIQLLEDWFFNMGGRGAQPSRGSRSKNVLVSAALIAIHGELFGDSFQTLVLASQPERLGEWRRGLQDALGLTREDFGPNSGIMLFERAEGVIERADRLEERGEVPLILIDATEQTVDIPLLQFPLWLAFAADPEELYLEEEIL